MKYIPRTLVNFDSFYGEDNHSSFDSAITLEFYVKSYEGFNGAQMLSKFGLQISEELTLSCASWGMFPNYEVRGQLFKEYVHGLAE
jgi:hypothetical protein